MRAGSTCNLTDKVNNGFLAKPAGLFTATSFFLLKETMKIYLLIVQEKLYANQVYVVASAFFKENLLSFLQKKDAGLALLTACGLKDFDYDKTIVWDTAGDGGRVKGLDVHFRLEEVSVLNPATSEPWVLVPPNEH